MLSCDTTCDFSIFGYFTYNGFSIEYMPFSYEDSRFLNKLSNIYKLTWFEKYQFVFLSDMNLFFL
jgi:hypothetical protein